MNEPDQTCDARRGSRWRELLSLPGEEPWSRVLCGGAAGAICSLVILLARHVVRVDPYIGLNIVSFVPVAGLFGGMLVLLALSVPKTARGRALAIPLVAALAGGPAWFEATVTHVPIEHSPFMTQFEREQVVFDMMSEVYAELCTDIRGDTPSAVWSLRRIPYLRPAVSTGTVALATVMSLVCIRMTGRRSLRRRLIAYAIGLCVILVARLAIAPAVLLIAPSLALVKLALWLAMRERAGLTVIVWLVAVDVGQLVGASQSFGRRKTAVLAVAAAVASVLAVVFWKPIAAEYSFVKGSVLLLGRDGEVPEASAAAFERAYALRPNNERNAYAYASHVLAYRGVERMSQRDHDAAAEVYLAAVKVFPKDADHYRMLGAISYRKGDRTAALSYCRKALTVARQTTAEDRRRWLALGFAISEHEKQLISALAGEGSDESTEEIVQFLKHANAGVASHAAKTLGDMGAKQATPALRETLRSRKDEDLLSAVRGALAELEQMEQ